jgi:hypothetical protein
MALKDFNSEYGLNVKAGMSKDVSTIKAAQSAKDTIEIAKGGLETQVAKKKMFDSDQADALVKKCYDQVVKLYDAKKHLARKARKVAKKAVSEKALVKKALKGKSIKSSKKASKKLLLAQVSTNLYDSDQMLIDQEAQDRSDAISSAKTRSIVQKSQGKIDAWMRNQEQLVQGNTSSSYGNDE